MKKQIAEINNTIGFLLIVIVMMFAFLVSIENSNHKIIQNYENVIYKMQTESLLKEKEIEIKELQRKIDSLELYQLNWQNINYWLDKFEVKHKEIAKQQIFLETGNLQSDICLTNNNLFGMRHPKIRPTTSIGANKSHAKYNNFVESIKDYALWQQAMYDDSQDYYSFLTRVGYAECETYISKLKYIKHNYPI